tara:strand:- start:146 stop:1234 length:1089 start_codon:yes stop_codon:yes gene_type:complete
MHEEISTHTTASQDVLQETLSKVVEASVQIAAMEVSSHSLAQYRVAGCHFAGLIFTNLTQDHLDYHGSMNEYFETKTRLFKQHYFKNDHVFPLVNIDNKWGNLLVKQLNGRCWRCSLDKDIIETHNVELYITNIEMTSLGFKGHLYTPAGDGLFVSPLIGHFNLMNLLQSVGVLIQQQLPLQNILKEIPNFPGVPGRMEKISFKSCANSVNTPTVIVDYAHTPDALKNALTGIRPFCLGKLVCVFGCGGDRDRSKRSKMGAIAAELADRIIVTSDNPRNEDPMRIINDILNGIPTGVTCNVEVHRSEAIELAISYTSSSDVVLLAGKGHEPYQIIGNQKKTFDDRKYARNALRVKANKFELS